MYNNYHILCDISYVKPMLKLKERVLISAEYGNAPIQGT